MSVLTQNTTELQAILEKVNTLVTVQTKTDSFTTNNNGEAFVNCGFQPDLVYIKGENYYDDDEREYYPMSVTVAFSLETRSGYPNVNLIKPSSGGSNQQVYDMSFERTETGFNAYIWAYDASWKSSAVIENTFEYTAVKYT